MDPMAERKINWDSAALKQFNKAIAYIAEQSLQNAEKIRAEVIQKVESLIKYPEANPLDKYKIDNDGNSRAFEIHHLRIAYFISPSEIRIIRVRSTYQE